MAEIQRSIVKKAFSAGAPRYDAHAVVQQVVLERFMALFSRSLSDTGSLLDIGAGTGRLLERLYHHLPETSLTGIDLAEGMAGTARQRFDRYQRIQIVCGDAERLPFADASFDRVVSTSTYQWINPLERAFAEVRRVLKPGALFCFALFGEKTLYELRESYLRSTGTGPLASGRTHTFCSTDDVLQTLMKTGFFDCQASDELETEIHHDVPDLIRSLKAIGAGSAAGGSGKGLSGRAVMARMTENYRNCYAAEGGIRATYHVIYGSGRR